MEHSQPDAQSNLLTMFRSQVDALDCQRSLSEIIESRGFVSQSHEVVTQDGYILTINRLYNGLSDSGDKYPVILGHGSRTGGAMWVTMDGNGRCKRDGATEDDECERSLAFCLANRNYDVWIINFRGSRLSRRHVEYDKGSFEFWNFSATDLSYDLMSVITYVKTMNKTETVGYIGYSMGSTAMLLLQSTSQEYNDVVKPCILLAPVWTLKYVFKGFKLSDKKRRQYRDKTCPSDGATMEQLIVSASKWLPWSWPLFMTGHFVSYLVMGLNWNAVSFDRVAVNFSHISFIDSSKSIEHTAQCIDREIACQFDYGPDKNLELYGSESAPIVDIGEIRNEYLCIVSSLGDNIANIKDIELTKTLLKGQLYDDFVIPEARWNHLDYYMSPHVGAILNRHIVTTLKRCLSADSNEMELTSLDPQC
ncbi:putative lysosomal acid lipase/cholesteryl ester hydrolase [Halotydeus destructor]|nr:putative lysosomal acid lipase/cholesteryl ester hydrolase [Halotydeus destructor]